MIVDIIIIRLSYGGHFYHYHWCCHYNNWHCYHYQSLIVTTSLIKQQFCSDSLNIFTKRYFYKTELKYSRSPSSANITLRRGVIWDLAQSARKFFQSARKNLKSHEAHHYHHHHHRHHHPHNYYPDPVDLVPLHHQVELLVNLVILRLRSRGQGEFLIIMFISFPQYFLLYFLISGSLPLPKNI